MVMIQDQRKYRRNWLYVCGICCLFLAFYLVVPRYIFADEENHGVSKHDSGEVNEGSAAQNKIVDEEWVSEKSGDSIPLDIEFADSTGRSIPLRAIIDKPTLILPIYFYCPNSCSFNLSYLANAIRNSTLKPGVDFKVIAFSFNDMEKIEDAKNAKINYLKMLPENFSADDWKFLVGTKKSIKALIDSLGYKVKRIPDGTFIHPSALVAVSAEGMIIKYVYGSFLPGDVDMALLEAKKGAPSLSVKRFLGFCFNTDSKKSTLILQRVKSGLLLVSLVLGGLFVVFIRRSGSKKGKTGERH
jgi:protein SCO1